MSKVSIIIPSRCETYEVQPGVTVLQRMVQDIYAKATGDFEVLVTQDGPPYQDLPDYPNLTVFRLPESIGLKPSVNMMAEKATGKYLLKFDSHCMVSEGITEVLQEGMQDNWIVIPRFYVLNAEEWKWQDERFYDYFFLSCPFTDKQFKFKAGGHDRERTTRRITVGPMDETMMMHGSGYFINRDFFLNKLGGWSSVGYDTFGFEHVEPAMKVWLGPWDGKVMVNKKAWYAHMHKGNQRPRGWPLSWKRVMDSYDWCARHWMKDEEPNMVHPLSWLVERFSPVPTWPENWREVWAKWLEGQNAVSP